MQHFLSTDQLSDKQIEEIFKSAEKFLSLNKKKQKSDLLSGHILINLFYENSTRTRVSFEVAARRLGMDVVNINIPESSAKKGESSKDTILTFNAMNPSFIVIRHSESGFPQMASTHSKASIINAGDGMHSHPTQSLLDAFSIKQKKGKIKGLKIAICGDIEHSRVARSNINLLTRLGAEITLVGPKTVIPTNFNNVEICYNFEQGIKDKDVIMLLRVQSERMNNCSIPSMDEYSKLYGLNRERLKLAKKDAVIMHPGPINRGVEIDDDLADDLGKNIILDQVENGVAIRQSIIEYCLLI